MVPLSGTHVSSILEVFDVQSFHMKTDQLLVFRELRALPSSVAGAYGCPYIVFTRHGFLPSDFERFNGCTGLP